MFLIQLTGLSGSGKSTLAMGVKHLLERDSFRAEVIDGDIYRKFLCPDLGFSREDRLENIRRLGFVANLLVKNGIIAILAAINPYEEARQKLKELGPHVYTVWIDCDMETLVKRDTKQLYKKAQLPDLHPEKIYNLTGVNDPYECPPDPDLVIHTHLEPASVSINTLYDFILDKCRLQGKA